jgi:hypothetical protein
MENIAVLITNINQLYQLIIRTAYLLLSKRVTNLLASGSAPRAHSDPGELYWSIEGLAYWKL